MCSAYAFTRIHTPKGTAQSLGRATCPPHQTALEPRRCQRRGDASQAEGKAIIALINTSRYAAAPRTTARQRLVQGHLATRVNDLATSATRADASMSREISASLRRPRVKLFLGGAAVWAAAAAKAGGVAGEWARAHACTYPCGYVQAPACIDLLLHK